LIGLRLPVTQNQAISEGLSQSADHRNAQWTCNACTVVNKPTDNKCMTCDNPQPAFTRLRSPKRFILASAHPPPYVDDHPPTAECSPDPTGLRRIVGTKTEETQTESVDTGNPAQKVLGGLGRVIQLVKSRSPMSSPRTQSPIMNMTWSAEDEIVTARWACTKCTHENSMDSTECGKCCYKEPDPFISFQ